MRPYIAAPMRTRATPKLTSMGMGHASAARDQLTRGAVETHSTL